MVSKEILRPSFVRQVEAHQQTADGFAPMKIERQNRLAHLLDTVRELFPDRGDLQILVLDALEVHIRQPLLEKISPRVRSRHTSFDATNILSRLSRRSRFEHKQYSVEQLLDLFPKDFKFFIDEAVLELTREYFDSDEEKKEKSDLDNENEYLESREEMSGNFIRLLEQAGKLQERTRVDNKNWENIQKWKTEMKNNPAYPIGSCLIVFSPAGGIVEGYAGIYDPDHALNWVWRKVLRNGVVDISMTQVKCWPPLLQIEELQKKWKKREVKSGILKPADMPIGRNRRQRIVANVIESDASLSTEEILHDISETEDTWTKDRSKIPKLTPAELDRFGRYRDAFLHVYLREAYLEYITHYADQLSQPYDHPFWTSKEYRQMVVHLDDTLLRASLHLQKCANDHDIPDPGIDLERDILDDELFIKMEEALRDRHFEQTGDFEPLEKFKLTKAQRRNIIVQRLSPAVREKVSNIHLVKELENEYEKGQLTNAQKELRNTLALELFAADLSGKVQCSVVGALKSPLMVAEQASTLGAAFVDITVFSALHPSLIPSEMRKLSPIERMQKLHDFLRKYTPLTIQTSHGEKRFWIQADQFDQYVGKVYEREDGLIVGPCNEEMTMSKDEHVRSEETYQAILLGSQMKEEKDEDAINAKISNSEIEANKIDTYKDREDRVSITELIAGDIHKAPSTGYNSAHGQRSNETTIRPNISVPTYVYQGAAA